MENTTENKERFFARYHGQELKKWRGHISELPSSVNIPIGYSKHWYLELTPLSQISDEDAIEVAKIATSGNFDKINRYANKINIHLTDNINPNQKYVVRIWFNTSNVYVYEQIHESHKISICWDQCIIFDFLRSKGHALPWMDVAVKTLVEWGWGWVELKK